MDSEGLKWTAYKTFSNKKPFQQKRSKITKQSDLKILEVQFAIKK